MAKKIYNKWKQEDMDEALKKLIIKIITRMVILGLAKQAEDIVFRNPHFVVIWSV